MGTRTTTIIIEPRSLMREALVSLMESLSYHVVGSVGSTNDLDRDVFKGAQPELVILGTLSADRALEATSTIRRRWQRAKITMLFETASSMDLQRLLASSLDACIPMFASPRTLLGTLQLIGCEHLRVFMVSDSAISSESSDRQDDGDSARQEGQALTTSLLPSFQITASQTSCAGNVLTNSPGDSTPRGGIHCLSEREEQILKALVRGHSNKVIARMCTVTEATVKVHVKSILRKIRVANRTQAAIWALKNAYFADDMDQTTRSVPMTDMQAVPSVSG